MYRRYQSANNLNPLWVLIGVNFVIFLATLIRPDIAYILGLKPAYFLQEPWTLITSIFIHGSFSHILFNSIALYFFGMFVISLVGETYFLATYFAGGIVGGLFYLLLPSSLFAPVVGASGAIYALGGILVAMRPAQPVYMIPIPIQVPLWVAVIIGFVLTLLPGIAWQAHLGGLILGLALGFYFRRRERQSYRWR